MSSPLQQGRPAPEAERRLDWRSLIFQGALALGVSWAVPAILYSPLLPVSLGRGMKISIFQALLRAFFYVFFAAVVMVVLAVVQIASAPSGG